MLRSACASSRRGSSWCLHCRVAARSPRHRPACRRVEERGLRAEPFADRAARRRELAAPNFIAVGAPKSGMTSDRRTACAMSPPSGTAARVAGPAACAPAPACPPRAAPRSAGAVPRLPLQAQRVSGPGGVDSNWAWRRGVRRFCSWTARSCSVPVRRSSPGGQELPAEVLRRRHVLLGLVQEVAERYAGSPRSGPDLVDRQARRRRARQAGSSSGANSPPCGAPNVHAVADLRRRSSTRSGSRAAPDPAGCRRRTPWAARPRAGGTGSGRATSHAGRTARRSPRSYLTLSGSRPYTSRDRRTVRAGRPRGRPRPGRSRARRDPPPGTSVTPNRARADPSRSL